MAPGELEAWLERKAKEDLDRLFQEIPFELRAKTIVVPGVAWDGICRTAQTENAEVIVIGSHGYGGIDRLLGTTASKVVNHADRSVLVVRERHGTR